MEVEKLKQEKLYDECQQKLFDEAKQKMLLQSSMDFKQKEVEINKSASLQTKNYCGGYDQKVFLVYKFLLTPDQMLLQGFQKMDQHSLRKYQLGLNLQLHPDKNSHPQAKDAFYKIQSLIQMLKH